MPIINIDLSDILGTLSNEEACLIEERILARGEEEIKRQHQKEIKESKNNLITIKLEDLTDIYDDIVIVLCGQIMDAPKSFNIKQFNDAIQDKLKEIEKSKEEFIKRIKEKAI